MLITTVIKHVTKVFAVSTYIVLIVGCNPQMRNNQTPDICKRVFGVGKIDRDIPKTLSIDDLITIEKCGFGYHPHVSFYSDIIDSKEYPLPSLLAELHRADDDHWKGRILYLIKAVIESERFHREVMRDRELIMQEIDLALEKTSKESSEYERIHDLRDGIEIYFLKQDGMKFGETSQ